MKIAGIISVGTEIMLGKIDDTNATYLCRWLKDCGIKVNLRLTVEDNIDSIVSAIKQINSFDLIILTGGLGPTSDDITREALAKFLNKKLVFQEGEYHDILSIFSKLNRPAPESNKKQAELIEGGAFLKNDFGSAPGMFYEEKGRVFVLLPGPPRENQPMVKNYLFPKLKDKGFVHGSLHSKVFRIYNVGESMVADLFVSFNEDVDIGYYFTSGGWCEIHLNKYINDENSIQGMANIKKLAIAAEKVNEALKGAAFFFTEDKDISHIVLDTLIEKGLTISFAESITGGNLSGEFVKNPGVSKVFLGSIVSYSNEVKRDALGVSQGTLDKYGAVSEEVVREMAFGLKKLTKSDIAISVSGIAGPDGATTDKPVGLVYFGFLFGDTFYYKKEIFMGTRARIMTRAVNMVFVEILKSIRDN